jgi:hypothetical protein
MKRVSSILLVLAGLLTSSEIQAAADFPPVTDEERAVTSVPGEPNAPAVVLFKKGELTMVGHGLVTGSLASHLRVQTRVKILTEAGKSNGEIVIGHNDFTKLKGFEGRTVLPDGRVLPVPADARFVRKTSISNKTFVTAVAFPSVEVGAILDYQYELVFPTPFLLEPWYFSEGVPVRRSEIVFKAGSGWKMRPWSRSPLGAKIQQEKESTARGEVVRAWAENLPAVPDDPYGPPYTDLAAQMMLLPASYVSGPYQSQALMETWTSLGWWVNKTYQDVVKKDAGVAEQARKVAAAGTSRQKAEALYRFVRDEIETGPGTGIFVDPESSLRQLLAERRASPAEKALLLHMMLKAVQVPSVLVWAGDRNHGTVDASLPNPGWFDTVLVLPKVDDGRSFSYLDPSDRALGFGQLRAGYEGTWALVSGAGGVQGVTLPEAPFTGNLRRAEIALALDEEGCLSGTGTLRLTGHPAWEKIGWQEDEAKAVQVWTAWLAGRYRDFQVSGVKVVEEPDERKVTVTWSLAQREEEVLGDETSLVPSAPLGPRAQPFVQPAAARKTMVMFDYASREEVELRLHWPETWKVESVPRPVSLKNDAGALAASVERKEGESSLTYRRQLDVTRRTLDGQQEYEMAQSLFGEAEKSDAQALLLVRR